MANSKIVLDHSAIEFLQEEVGGTYTAGNGITITDERVINADIKAIRLQQKKEHPVLTNEQCESLKIGDTVTYRQANKVHTETSFTVTRKEGDFMYLTHLETDYSVWCEAYVKTDGVWQYDQDLSDENTMHLAEYISSVYLGEPSGNINLEDFQSIMEKGCCYIFNDGEDEAEKMAIFSGSSDYEGEPLPVLSTAVYQGKYYTVTFEPVAPEDPEGKFTFNYTVNEVQVGGGGVEYIELSTSSGTLNYEQIQKLTSGNYIKYNDTVLIPNGYEQQGGEIGGSRTYYFASTISNDVYLSMSVTLSLPIPPSATATYTVTEVSVGGGSGTSIFTLNLSSDTDTYETGTLSQEDIENLTNLLSIGEVTVEITQDGSNESKYLTKASHFENNVQNSYVFSTIIGTDNVDSYSVRINLTNGKWTYNSVNLYSSPK